MLVVLHFKYQRIKDNVEVVFDCVLDADAEFLKWDNSVSVSVHAIEYIILIVSA